VPSASASAPTAEAVPDEFKLAHRNGLEWMWADAALLPGLEGLAAMNPLRWKKLRTGVPHIVWVDRLRFEGQRRPVNLRVIGAGGDSLRFATPQAAAAWIHRWAEQADQSTAFSPPLRSTPDPVCRTGPPAEARYPAYWNNGSRIFKDAILLPRSSLALFQQLMDESYVSVSTRDRSCPARPQCKHSKRVAGGCHCSRPGGVPGLPIRYRVRQVLRVEDSALWNDYTKRRSEIVQERRRDASARWDFDEPLTAKVVRSAPQAFAPLEAQASEMYLFHGTNTRTSLKIASEDVRLNLSNPGGGLGPGLYLGESVTKSDEYASDTSCAGSDDPDEYYGGVFAMLVMRVSMGKVRPTDKFFSDAEKQVLTDRVFRCKDFDSVVCDRRKSVGTYREFCVFDKNQIYAEYVILYERVYQDPAFGLSRLRVSGPRPSPPGMSGDGEGVAAQGEVLHFQVPSYWNNFHKNPDRESFDEETVVRPRGYMLIQRTLRLLSGSEGLTLLQATRLENSVMLQEYVAVKLLIRKRDLGISNPGLASKLVLSAEQSRAFLSAGLQNAFSPENIEEDINEVYVWAGVPLTADGQIPDIRSAAAVVMSGRHFFGNPADAMHHAPALADGRRAVFLCRVVCGEIRQRLHSTEVSTEVGADADTLVSTTGIGHAFTMLFGDTQVYPEMLAHVAEPI